MPVETGDPRLVLAQRLRALRKEHWPDAEITQVQLAQALGGRRPLSVPLISSWESQSAPAIPPLRRIQAYAALFATRRSLAAGELRLIARGDMTADEAQAMEGLWEELRRLRAAALAASHPASALRAGGRVASARLDQVAESLSTGPWRFEDGHKITIVCAQWPLEMMQQIPYTNISDPDYIELLTMSELDSLFELYGFLRASNPANDVNLRVAHKLTSDDYSAHLVTLGGIDWNTTTASAMKQLRLPVEQVAQWGTPDGQYFEVAENGKRARHQPVMEGSGAEAILLEDVALFARAVNPFNQKRTLTICSGMYGRGTYGAVRALTDPRFRDRNNDYLDDRFGDSSSYCILTRVPILNGATLTPDWTISGYRLFEWSAPDSSALA
jgi:hypothetical protein